MNPYDFWVPLFAIAGIAVVGPVWWHFVSTRLSGVPGHWQFFATMSLPAIAALLAASWLEPR